MAYLFKEPFSTGENTPGCKNQNYVHLGEDSLVEKCDESVHKHQKQLNQQWANNDNRLSVPAKSSWAIAHSSHHKSLPHGICKP